MTPKKVLIVGGGFAGINCALHLAKANLPGVKIILISDTPHFEYHAALYRVVTGRSPLEVCVPLSEIFAGLDVELVKDRILSVDLEKQSVRSAERCEYDYDYLVLAVGAEPEYYQTPGLEELAFGFKTIHEALRLKRHLHELLQSCTVTEKDQTVCNAHLVIVGGGASGTEVAAELAIYMKQLACEHGVDPSFITIDLIQSPNRLLPTLKPAVSAKIEKQIRSLGVNVYLNRRLVKEEVEQVYLKDMQMQSKTVIWAAGIRANHLYSQIKGLEVNKGGHVEVNPYLQAKGQPRVYVGGDGAVTQYTGMAQTALRDGAFIANDIRARLTKKHRHRYVPKEPIYAIPVGPGWAAVTWSGRQYYGRIGWWLRRLLDLFVFMTILPFSKAWTAWKEGEILCESCEVCGNKSNQKNA